MGNQCCNVEERDEELIPETNKFYQQSLGIPFTLQIEYIQPSDFDKEKYKEVCLTWEDLGKICSLFGQTSIGEIKIIDVDHDLKSHMLSIQCYAPNKTILNRWFSESIEELNKIFNFSTGHFIQNIEK
jgi:hypothetical protein